MMRWQAIPGLNQETAQNLRGELIGHVLDCIKHVKPLDSGYLLHFGTSESDLFMVAEWISIERICNPFLRFKLMVGSNGGPISLELAGPAGTQAFLHSELALSRWM